MLRTTLLMLVQLCLGQCVISMNEAFMVSMHLKM